MAIDPSERFFANYFTTFLSFLIDDDLIGAMDLVIGENAILKKEPPRTPSLAVVDPLVQNAGDSVAHNVVDPHRRQPRKRFHRRRRRSLDRPAAIVAEAVIAITTSDLKVAAVAVAAAIGGGMRSERCRRRWWHVDKVRQRRVGSRRIPLA